jgi:hypothetical protein
MSVFVNLILSHSDHVKSEPLVNLYTPFMMNNVSGAELRIPTPTGVGRHLKVYLLKLEIGIKIAIDECVSFLCLGVAAFSLQVFSCPASLSRSSIV